MNIDERRKKEHTKLTKQFQHIDERKKKIVEKLIQNASFIAVALEDLQKMIDENGYISEYKNGENQYGTKKSPEVETYNQMLSNYMKAIKQLTDLMPDNIVQNDSDLDDINAFIKK